MSRRARKPGFFPLVTRWPIQWVLLGIFVAPVVAEAQRRLGDGPRRALPPQWSRDVMAVFFDDARRVLVGARPEPASARAGGSAEKASDRSDRAGQLPDTAEFAWSTVIAAEVIEDEVKGIGQRVAEQVRTANGFKGGGFRDCRKQFSLLAVLFAILDQYDGRARWQEQAAGLSGQFARAGFNCKVGTDATYKEATLRSQDLRDLVRGERITVAKSEPRGGWEGVADRPPLMQRIELAYEKRLAGWLADEKTFRSQSDDVRHEAQILAALAEVIQREGYEYWDDDAYIESARLLRKSASEIVRAVEQSDYEGARQAAGMVSKSCSRCHEDYRG